MMHDATYMHCPWFRKVLYRATYKRNMLGPLLQKWFALGLGYQNMTLTGGIMSLQGRYNEAITATDISTVTSVLSRCLYSMVMCDAFGYLCHTIIHSPFSFMDNAYVFKMNKGIYKRKVLGCSIMFYALNFWARHRKADAIMTSFVCSFSSL